MEVGEVEHTYTHGYICSRILNDMYSIKDGKANKV